MRPLPTTAEIIEETALRSPRQPALREGGSELDYGQFLTLLEHCALALQQLGVRPGQRVAVGGPGMGIQLVLLLAAEGLGATTASFAADGDPDARFLFERVDWVFAGRPQAVPAGVRFQLVDEAFARSLDRPRSRVRPAWAAPPLDAPQRIVRTSGSSGRSKFMVVRRQALEHWTSAGIEKAGWGPGTRLLVLAPLVVNAGYTRICQCLRRGGMVLAGGGADVPQLQATDVWGLPAQLERLLAELPAGWTSPRPVAVATVGGALSPQLRAGALRAFGGIVRNRYGTNETGHICEDLDDDAVGLLAAGVDLRILGPDGGALPPGEVGVIAVRTPSMVDGYLDLPADTAAAFRDGWFVSGDLGVLLGDRRLRLLGRHDDLLNLGGLKLPAAQLEAQLQALPAIQRCSAQAVHLEAGAVTLGLAIVLAPGATREQAMQQLQAALGARSGLALRLVFLPQLPLLPTGKVDRLALLRLLGPQPA